jgi:hypothetical protein
MQDLLGGAILMYAAYSTAEQGLPACKAVPSAFEKIGNMDKMKIMNIIAEDTLNGDQIFDMAENAVKSYQAGKFEEFGIDMGLIL